MRRIALVSLVDAILLTSPLAALVARAEDAAPAGVSASAGKSASAEPPALAPAASTAAAVDPETAAKERTRDMRTGSTFLGAAGGFAVVDAAAPAAKSLRIQAVSAFFVKKDYLYNNDKERVGDGMLSLAYVPFRNIELTAATTTRVAKNDRADPSVLYSVGNMHFGVKAGGELKRGVALGGDVLTSFLSGPGDAGVDFSGTSVGLRGSLGIDLRKLTTREVPLLLRGNFAYVFDNSANMVKSTERARLANLQDAGITSATSGRDEYRQLVRRDERLALGVNRVDVARVALGLEAPLAVGKHAAIHPIAEWQLDIPVNRQGYDCAFIGNGDGGKLGGTDSCLADEGVDVWHQHVFLGARFYPYQALNLLAGVDVGVGGASNFVQELAPNTPYRILLGAGYNADLAPPPPAVREVEKRVEVEKLVERPGGRLRGRVVEQGDEGIVVGGAKIDFPGRTLNSLLVRADGTFETYLLEPGDVQLSVEAEGYEPAHCGGAIPVAGGDVDVVCTLPALPRVGSLDAVIVDESGAPVGGVSVLLVGPESRMVTSDATGHATGAGLKPGNYRARIEQEGYLWSNTELLIPVRAAATPRIQLVHTPKAASVVVSKNKITLKGTVQFATGTAEIAPASTALLTELADVLQKHSEILRVEVQGHTDDRGDPATNLSLSQARADAVKGWLSSRGVDGDRLEAKGYGSQQPLLPNLSEWARTKNRRVELKITSRAGQ
jgi:OmpA-OmpF porin, OOP family